MGWQARSVAALAVAIAGSACTVGAPTPEPVEEAASELVVLDGASCVSLLAGQSIVAGSVCASIDGDDLMLTYATTGDWRLDEAHLWAGLSILSKPQTNSGNPKVGLFPYGSGALAGVTTDACRVPLSTFGLASRMEVCNPVVGYVVAHAAVKRTLADGSTQSETAYGEGTRLVQKGNWATWFSVRMTCEDPPPELGTCETSFAYDSTCSLSWPN